MESSWLLQLDWAKFAEIFGDLIAPALSLVALLETRKIAKQTNNYIRSQQHGNYWMAFLQQPEFLDVMNQNRNITAQPVTLKEEIAVGRLFLHFQDDFVTAKHGLSSLPTNIAKDIQAYFSFPTVIEVWKKRRKFLEPDFVAFVEGAYKSAVVPLSNSSGPKQSKAA